MKMKVGEIEFDSESTVSFSETATARLEDREGETPDEPQLDRIDRKARRALALAGMLLAIVTGSLALAGTLLQLEALFLVAGFTFLTAMTCLVAYLGIGLKTVFRTGESSRNDDESASELEGERVRRLRNLLADEPATVDRLLDQTGWTEAALLPALARLVSDGEVDEDLDLDSGAWTYRLASNRRLDAEPPRHTLNLDDRIESISERKKEPATHEKGRKT